MKRTNIIFWIITVLFSAFMVSTAIPEIMQTADSKNFMNHLGYPDYFNPFIGTLKVLGIAAILMPGIPRLKEWAYAGLFFDLVGALYSQVATDGFMWPVLFMLVPMIFLGLSYAFWHKRLNNMNMASRKHAIQP